MSIIVELIRSSIFSSRGQVDLMHLQASQSENSPYNFLLVYQDHLQNLSSSALLEGNLPLKLHQRCSILSV